MTDYGVVRTQRLPPSSRRQAGNAPTEKSILMLQYEIGIGEGEVLLPSLGGVLLWVSILAVALFRRRPPKPTRPEPTRPAGHDGGDSLRSVTRPQDGSGSPANFQRHEGLNSLVHVRPTSEHRNGDRSAPPARRRDASGSPRSSTRRHEGGVSPRRAGLDDDEHLHEACCT
jgi:hypothetical protein